MSSSKISNAQFKQDVSEIVKQAEYRKLQDSVKSGAAMTDERSDLLTDIWWNGFSIKEIWGFSGAVTRGTEEIKAAHPLIWGLLGIVEYQMSKGAGHRYLRERLWKGDWIAIGVCGERTADSKLEVVPRFENAKFGRRRSAIGDDTILYTDVRIVHSHFYGKLMSEEIS